MVWNHLPKHKIADKSIRHLENPLTFSKEGHIVQLHHLIAIRVSDSLDILTLAP